MNTIQWLAEDQREKLRCINVGVLSTSKKIVPPLDLNEVYYLKAMHVCSCGEVHYLVSKVLELETALSSKQNFVSCYKCEEHLPDGDTFHWAHHSRFVMVPV
jgi:hypothetical protein